MVVVVGGLALLDEHTDDDGSGDLGFFADELGGEFAGLASAVVAGVGGAGLVRAFVGISGGVVIVNGVEIGHGADAHGDVGDLGSESVGVFGGGLVNLEAFFGLDVDFVAGGLGWSEAGEGADVGGEIAVDGAVAV